MFPASSLFLFLFFSCFLVKISVLLRFFYSISPPPNVMYFSRLLTLLFCRCRLEKSKKKRFPLCITMAHTYIENTIYIYLFVYIYLQQHCAFVARPCSVSILYNYATSLTWWKHAASTTRDNNLEIYSNIRWASPM